MPWDHCGNTINDDDLCPGCGLSKQNWTIEFDVTRSFKVTRRHVAKFALLDDDDEEPLPQASYRVRFPEGTEREGRVDEYGYAKEPAPAAGTYELILPRVAPGDVAGVEPEPEGQGEVELDGQPSACLTLKTNRRYEVRLQQVFELAFQRFGEPLAGASYRLLIDDADERSGTLDDEGALREALPADASEAEVWIDEGSEEEQHYLLSLGGLASPEDTSGLQQRLNNLGYLCGEEDGQAGAVTRQRLESFQRAAGLEESGQLDDATKAKLLELHGS